MKLNLAAAAGTPTLQVLYGQSWTALGQDHEPFTPWCTCVTPASMGNWEDVFAQVTAKLPRQAA